MQLQIEIEEIKFESEFVLKINFFTNEAHESCFEFGNHAGGFERNCLHIEDSFQNELHPYEILYIKPKDKGFKTTTNISSNKSFQYQIKGNIKEVDNKILIEFKSISWLINKGEIYYLSIKFRNAESKKKKINFPL